MIYKKYKIIYYIYNIIIYNNNARRARAYNFSKNFKNKETLRESTEF